MPDARVHAAGRGGDEYRTAQSIELIECRAENQRLAADLKTALEAGAMLTHSAELAAAEVDRLSGYNDHGAGRTPGEPDACEHCGAFDIDPHLAGCPKGPEPHREFDEPDLDDGA